MADQISLVIDNAGLDASVQQAIRSIGTLESKVEEANEKSIRIIIDNDQLTTLNAYTKAVNETNIAYKAIQGAAAGAAESVQALNEVATKSAITEQKNAIINKNRIDAQKAAEADLLQSQIAFGERYIALLEKESIAEQAAAIKNKNTIDKRKTAEADLRQAQEKYGLAYIAMLDKQAAAEQAAQQKIVSSQSAIYNSVSGLKARMIEMQMAGEGLSAEYEILAQRANILATAQERVNNAVANPQAYSQFRQNKLSEQNTPVVITAEETKEAENYEERLTSLQIQIEKTTESKIAAFNATKAETVATDQNIISQKAEGESIDLVSVKIKQLEDNILGLNTLIKSGGRPENIELLNKQLAKTNAELAILKGEAGQAGNAMKTLGSDTEKSGNKADKASNKFTFMGVNIERRIGSMIISFAAWMLVIPLITSGLSAVWDWMTKLSDASQALKDRTDALADSQKAYAASVIDAKEKNAGDTIKEAINLDSLIKVYKEAKEGTDDRIKAYNELQEAISKVLQPLTDEEIKTKKITQAHEDGLKKADDYNKALKAEALIHTQISDALEQQNKDRAVVQDFEKNASPEAIDAYNSLNTGSSSTALKAKAIAHLNVMEGAKKFAGIDAASAYIAAKFDIDNQNATIAQGTNYLVPAIQKRMSYEVLPERKDKKPRSPRNQHEIAGTADTGSIDIEIAETKKLAEANKEVWEDESRNLEEKFQANAKYYQLQAAIVELEKQKKFVENDQKQKDIVTRIGENLRDMQSGKLDKKTGEADNASLREQYNKITKEQKVLEVQSQADIAKVKTEAIKNTGAIWKKDQDFQLEIQKQNLEQELDTIQDGALKEEQILQDKYRNGLIDAKEFNKEKQRIEDAALNHSIDAQIRAYRIMLNSQDLVLKTAREIERKIRELEMSKIKSIREIEENRPTGAMPELEAGIDSSREAREQGKEAKRQHSIAANADPGSDEQKDAEQAETKALQNQKIAQLQAVSHYTSQAIDVYSQFYDAVKQMRDNAFAAEQQQLEIQQRELNVNTQLKINAINATTEFAITKDNQLAVVAAQNQAAQNSLTQQQNALALKKAKADKQAAESEVLMNTAKAITAALPLLATPATIAIGIAEIATITALGAAQYAAAASTPLPQFFKGGYTATPIFSAGEKGAELMVSPSGEATMSKSTATAYKGPIGTKIYSHEQTMAILRNMAVPDSYGEFTSTATNMNVDGLIKEFARNNKLVEEGFDNLLEQGKYNKPIVNNTILIKSNPLQMRQRK